MQHTLQSIVRTLRETREIATIAVRGLVQRGSVLRELELRTRSLANDGEEFSQRAQELRVRQQCTLACVVLVALAACFLLLVAFSYATQPLK